MLTLLAGSDRRSYRRLIKLFSKELKGVEAFEKEIDSDKEAPDPMQNTLDAMNFVVHKIETLRIITKVKKADKSLFKEINLNTRFKNIKKALVEVYKTLKIVILKKEKRIRLCWF